MLASKSSEGGRPMSRGKVENVVMLIVTAVLFAAVVWIATRMQVLRPVDYREDMRFKTLPTANPAP